MQRGGIKKGLEDTSSCVQDIIPQTPVNGPGTDKQNFQQALKIARCFMGVFGDDFYLEVHRHGIAEEKA